MTVEKPRYLRLREDSGARSYFHARTSSWGILMIPRRPRKGTEGWRSAFCSIHANRRPANAPGTRCRDFQACQEWSSNATQSTISHLPTIAPTGSPSTSTDGPPQGVSTLSERSPACSHSSPRYEVGHDRTSMVFTPRRISSTHGCLMLTARSMVEVEKLALDAATGTRTNQSAPNRLGVRPRSITRLRLPRGPRQGASVLARSLHPAPRQPDTARSTARARTLRSSRCSSGSRTRTRRTRRSGPQPA